MYITRGTAAASLDALSGKVCTSTAKSDAQCCRIFVKRGTIFSSHAEAKSDGSEARME
jgi:hypothetical protein